MRRVMNRGAWRKFSSPCGGGGGDGIKNDANAPKLCARQIPATMSTFILESENFSTGIKTFPQHLNRLRFRGEIRDFPPSRPTLSRVKKKLVRHMVSTWKSLLRAPAIFVIPKNLFRLAFAAFRGLVEGKTSLIPIQSFASSIDHVLRYYHLLS
jgi:hypothetical protein